MASRDSAPGRDDADVLVRANPITCFGAPVCADIRAQAFAHSFDRIAAAVHQILDRGALPVAVGRDLVEVSPSDHHPQITSPIAARLRLDCPGAIVENR